MSSYARALGGMLSFAPLMPIRAGSPFDSVALRGEYSVS